jgi:hypothetical protein
MTEDAARFRRRAEQCRQLSKRASDEYSRSTLSQMAIELDEEAGKIEAEEGGNADYSST